jgi:ribosomal protein S18 acetylase RimI-like enzyme
VSAPPASPQPFFLRPATAADEPFLRALYRSTREAEFAMLGWTQPQVAALCDMQFRAQAAGYRRDHPGAEYLVICAPAGEAVGRLTRARYPDALLLVDIAVLPAFRGRGAGTWAIRTLQDEAAARAVPLFLHVDKANPALSLYQRLGFVIESDDGMRYGMRWVATAVAPP